MAHTADSIECANLTASGNVSVGGTALITGVLTCVAPPIVPTVAFSALPSASPAGQLVFCATGSDGVASLLFSNGSAWIAVDDLATASES